MNNNIIVEFVVKAKSRGLRMQATHLLLIESVYNCRGKNILTIYTVLQFHAERNRVIHILIQIQIDSPNRYTNTKNTNTNKYNINHPKKNTTEIEMTIC